MSDEYAWVTRDMYQAKLEEIVKESPASHLLSIAGVNEAVSEEFNNAVLKALEDEREDSDG